MARSAATARKLTPGKVPPGRTGGSKVAASKGGGTGAVARRKDAKFESLSADQKVTVLLAERERLTNQIGLLEQQLSHMRSRQSEVADRVEWALDSLRDILGERSK